jgi:hypothetical protein
LETSDSYAPETNGDEEAKHLDIPFFAVILIAFWAAGGLFCAAVPQRDGLGPSDFNQLAPNRKV